jgi:hypothetical protein
VSKAGDVNGDGNSDFIVGGYLVDMQGVAFVIFGNTATIISEVDFSTFQSGFGGFKITNAGSGSRLGFSVSGGGDFNDDGFDDVIVGAPYASPQSRTGAGQVFVIFGHSQNTAFMDVSLTTFPAGPGGFTISGAQSNSMLGSSVAFAGDFNGDGCDDIVMGSPQSAVVYVILGNNIAFSIADIDLLGYVFGPTTGFRISGNGGSGEQFGYSVAGAGDVNGDRKADIIIGAPGTACGVNGINLNCGAAYVLFGSSIVNGDIIPVNSIGGGSMIGFKIAGAMSGDQSGTSVSGAGDVNGDNIADILVGGPNVDSSSRSDAGMTYVIFGRRQPSIQDVQLAQFTTTGSSLGFGIFYLL